MAVFRVKGEKPTKEDLEKRQARIEYKEHMVDNLSTLNSNIRLLNEKMASLEIMEQYQTRNIRRINYILAISIFSFVFNILVVLHSMGLLDTILLKIIG